MTDEERLACPAGIQETPPARAVKMLYLGRGKGDHSHVVAAFDKGLRLSRDARVEAEILVRDDANIRHTVDPKDQSRISFGPSDRATTAPCSIPPICRAAA